MLASQRTARSSLLSRSIRVGVALALVAGATVAQAFQGPYASIVTGSGGYQMDLDVRWPNGAPPAGGWPVVFFCHGAGGDKTSSANVAGRYADDGYVTLTWTNRTTASNPSPETLAADEIALKSWLVNDFQAEAGVTAPVDPARFGITGGSLGGYTSWSGGLLSGAFATIAPNNWGFHFFEHGITLNGSIDRITGGPRAALFPTPYDDVSLQAAFDAAFGPATAAFANVTIPVMMQMAMLDARTGGTYALQDYHALTAAPTRLLYLGTGGHGTPDTDDGFRGDLRERWFAHYLQGVDNGIDTEPPIQVALLGTNERLAYTSWPPPDQQSATLWLRDGGVLSPVAPTAPGTPATIVNDPGTYDWDDATPNFPPSQIRNNLPKQTVAWESAPFTDDVLMIGDPTVRLELSGTGSRYQVNIHLYDRADGQDPLTLATTSATLGTSPVAVDLTLSMTARRIPAGHRLRLEITNRDDQDLDSTNVFNPSAETLRHIPFFEPSTTQVFADVARPSSLTIPMIGRDTLPLPGIACDPAPRAGCRLPVVAGASSLTIKNETPDTRDSFSWKWSKGAAVTFAELGSPMVEDAYTFCVYDGAGALQLEARAPEGGTCRTKPCWKQLGSATKPRGWQYADRDLTPDGVKTLKVEAGEASKAKASVSGKGENLGASGHFPTLPLVLPVVAQLQSTGLCLQVAYATAKVNDAKQLKAK